MKNREETAKPLEWQEIEARTVEGLDAEAVGTRHAIDHWRADCLKTQRNADEADLFHIVSTPAARAALIAYFRSDIAENEALYRLKSMRNARDASRAQLEEALGTHEGVFVNTEAGERFVPELQGVIRVSEQQKNARRRRVVEAISELAHTPEDLPAFPAIPGAMMDEFSKDLREILTEGGDLAKETVLQICKDRRFASEVTDDSRVPGVLQFLASLVLTVKEKDSLPAPARALGFAGATECA